MYIYNRKILKLIWKNSVFYSSFKANIYFLKKMQKIKSSLNWLNLEVIKTEIFIDFLLHIYAIVFTNMNYISHAIYMHLLFLYYVIS